MNSKQRSYVVIGNGIAGITAAEILRSEDATSSISIVADDPFPAYYRPALKDFLGGRLPEEKLWARPTTFYQDQRIRFIPGRVVGIRPAQHLIHLQNSKTLPYQQLLLANGARPRTLSCPGLDLQGVFTLRTLADYQAILQHLEHVRRVVVCGSGTLALESAETLHHCGYQVTHLLRGNRLWSEILDPVASDMVLQEEQRDGIDVRTSEFVAKIVGKRGKVQGVITTGGTHLPCELVLIAIGIEPMLDFIRVSGIACGRGVKVDSWMRTNAPDIYAAGDVIEVTDDLTGRTRVLGQWFPAIQQARIAARAMLNPETDALNAPKVTCGHYYNATFLYGLDFVSLGLTTGPLPPACQEVIAEPQPRSYRKAFLSSGRLVGALLLGNRRQALAFKRALDHRVNLAPVAQRLFADDFNLDQWLDQQHVPAPLLDSSYKDEETRPYTDSTIHRNETMTLQGKEYRRDLLGIEAYLVPVPHPHVQVNVTEIALSQASSTNVVSIGRQAGASWQLEHSSISRLHATITCTDGEYVLRDVGSSNGTFVNGSRLARQRACMLGHQDQVRFGDVRFRFELRQSSTTNISTNSREQMEAKGPKPVLLPGTAHLPIAEPLDQQHLAFEINMCIGCNRCMDVCPVPGSSQIAIAPLNQATLSQPIPPAIARFTHECILCGSCVPVCPVDNHRDLLMLALKQRLGTSWESQPDMQRVSKAIPTGWTQSLLLQRLREQKFLRAVPDTYLLHIAAASQTRILAPGETLIQAGEYGRTLYIILDGVLEITTTDRNDRELALAMLQRGEYLGEDGMLTGQPYHASAHARTPTLLLTVPEQVMQRLMELVPEISKYFKRLHNARSLTSILKRMELFQGVADADLQALISATAIKYYERGEQLFTEEQGSRPTRETLHILLEGFVKVARQTRANAGQIKGSARIIAYRQAGDYFAGGLDLLGDRRAVTVTTINRCRVAEVPRSALLALFRRYPQADRRFSLRLREYLETAASTRDNAHSSLQRLVPNTPPADPDVQAGLDSLIKDGVIEGTEVLVIDLDKCIHCNECEEACARRHGHSRMNRQGMVVGNISIATACRQCQDPVCMLCSRAGIARHPNGEVYITESCIGCGICAERCPYGAISIAQIAEEEPARQTWQRFSSWFTRPERSRRSLPMVSAQEAGGNYAVAGPLDAFPTRDGYTELRKKIALKCDLCVGYNDQACVQACPTGAAIRIQPTRFFGSTEDILRRRVN